MAVYFDASALVKLTVGETGSDDVRRLWASTESVATSLVAYPEVTAALAAGLRAGRLTRSRHRAATGQIDRIWRDIDVVATDEPLALFAGALAGRHGLRALDAIHLASTLTSEASVLVSWDCALRDAALAEGVDVFPA